MDNFGFLKVAAAVPHVRVGDCDFNTERIAAMAEEAVQRRLGGHPILVAIAAVLRFHLFELFQQLHPRRRRRHYP